MRTMRAAVLYEYGQPLRVEKVRLDDPGPREVLVKIAASGICRSDLHVMKGEWRPPLPIVLGHEASGTVEQVGTQVRHVRSGEPIILSFAPHCGYCRYCVTGSPHLCATMRAEAPGMLPGGSTRLEKDGVRLHHFARTASFAEYAVIHESAAIPVSPEVSLELAALVGCAVTTGVGAAINTARVTPGSTVAVVGCGGVGLNIVQGARLAGAARIIAVDLHPEKLSLARHFGATETIDATTVEPVSAIKELSAGGVDFAFEALGSGPTIKVAYDALRPGGVAVVVGMAPTGEEARVDAYALAFQEKTLKGCFYGSARDSVDMPRLIALAQAGQLDLDHLVTRRYDLSEINEAFAALDSGAPGRGLIVFP